jgi:peptide/nickel transport system ATP-binding protein
VCGWESRDLRELLERRWSLMPEEDYRAEQALIADMDPLDSPGTTVRLPAKGGRGKELLALLEQARDENPEEPFWRGVKGLEQAGDAVEVEFFEPLEPRLLPSGAVQVHCHLYDEEALRVAERRRAEQAVPAPTS